MYCITMATSKVDAETPSLHKAAAQPEHSIYEGKSLNKVFPKGEHKEMGRFVPTDPRSYL